MRSRIARAVVCAALLVLSGCGDDTDAPGGKPAAAKPDGSVLGHLGKDADALCSTSVVSDEALTKALGASAVERKGSREDGVAGSVVYTCDIATDGTPKFVSITAANSSDKEKGSDKSVLDLEMRGQTLGLEDTKYQNVPGLGSVAGFYHQAGSSSVIVTVLTINEERMSLTFKIEDAKLKEPDAMKKLKALGQTYIDGLTAHAG